MGGLLLAWPLSPASAVFLACPRTACAQSVQEHAGWAGAVYHNADCQTPRSTAPVDAPPALSRETQTLRTAAHACQAPRHVAVQMARRGLVLDASRDRVLRPGALLLAAC